MTNSASLDENLEVISRNARYGLGLFAVYVAFYAGFIFLAVFQKQALAIAEPVLGGVDIAMVYIAYGFGLIGAALILAMVYMLLCRRPLVRNS